MDLLDNRQLQISKMPSPTQPNHKEGYLEEVCEQDLTPMDLMTTKEAYHINCLLHFIYLYIMCGYVHAMPCHAIDAEASRQPSRVCSLLPPYRF